MSKENKIIGAIIIAFAILMVAAMAGKDILIALKNIPVKGDIKKTIGVLKIDVKEIKDVSELSLPKSNFGKFLIWDKRTNKILGSAQDKLNHRRYGDGAYRVRDLTKPFTLLVVFPECEKILVGHYKKTGLPAYEEWVKVVIALWPQKEFIGYFSTLTTKDSEEKYVDQKTYKATCLDSEIAYWVTEVAETNKKIAEKVKTESIVPLKR